MQFMEIKRQIFWWVSVIHKKGRELGFPPFQVIKHPLMPSGVPDALPAATPQVGFRDPFPCLHFL